MNISKKILSLLSAAAVLLSFAAPAFAAADRTVVFGDLDEDGVLSSSDARFALRCAVALEYYTRGHVKIGDTDGDARLTASDARELLRFCVGIDDPEVLSVQVNEEDFLEYVNKPQDNGLFEWILPDAPAVNAPPDTFTFTVYGFGHGVGLSQYGALSLEDGGYTYDRILSHYYTGTEISVFEEMPEFVVYPSYEYDEETDSSRWVQKEHSPEELLVRIVYQEIYGVTKGGKYKEALKALTLCVFSNLAYYDFNIKSRWDVGIASTIDYESIPDNLKSIVKEVLGQYITVKGSKEPIMAVYSGLAAGMTAASESIWGGSLSYLTPVPSPFDMGREGFITQYTYTSEEIRELIESYDSSIVLQDDPSLWLRITEHTGSMDESRGYVVKIKVGNKELKGYNQFLMGIMNNTLRSPCFTVTYTPADTAE